MYFSQLLLGHLYICILWASSHNLFYRTTKAPGCLVSSRYDPLHSVCAFPNHVMSNQLNLPLKASYRNSWQIISGNTIYLNAVNTFVHVIFLLFIFIKKLTAFKKKTFSKCPSLFHCLQSLHWDDFREL